VPPFSEHGGADLQLLGDFGDGFTKVEQADGFVFELLV
jgi:hypothetical protein